MRELVCGCGIDFHLEVEWIFEIIVSLCTLTTDFGFYVDVNLARNEETVESY